MAELPMFPLGMVLFPSLTLSLRVFEPRYRQLVHACLDGSREFGVVLIERGSEVGGGDIRSNVGTAASIVQLAQLPDSTFAIQVVGTRRIGVQRWLDDDPYPRADVVDLEDDEADGDLAERHRSNVALLRRVLALSAELGDRSAPATIELSGDVVLGGYQAAAVAPAGPADHYKLLAAPGPSQRAELLEELLREQCAVLEFRMGELRSGSGGGGYE